MLLAIAIIGLAIPAALLPMGLLAASDARSRASTAADLIALAGCEHENLINRYRETVVLSCTDDGNTIEVRTRTRIAAPSLLGVNLHVHAHARAAHIQEFS